MSATTWIRETPLPNVRFGPGGPAICLLGAAPDTGNLGVSALGAAAASMLHAAIPLARIVVQQHSSRILPHCDGAGHNGFVEPLYFHSSTRLRDRRGVRH